MKKLIVMSLSLVALLSLTFTEINSQTRQRQVKKYNPLHRAILKGSKSLVKKYSKPRYFYYFDESTPLPIELAFRQDRMDLAKIMVSRGLNVDHKKDAWDTAIIPMVCTSKWLKFMISAGADKNQIIQSLGNQSLLHIAARCPQSESLKFLLHRGVYREAKSVTGATPLFLAVSFKRYKNARILIAAGAKMEYRYKGEKFWALKNAIGNHDPVMVKLLLDSLHRVKPNTDLIYMKLVDLKNDNRRPGTDVKGDIIKIFNMLVKKGLIQMPVKAYTCKAFAHEPELAEYWIDNVWKNKGWKITDYRHKYGGSMLSCAYRKEDVKWLMGKAKWLVSPVAMYAERRDFKEARRYVEEGYDINGKDARGRNVLFFTGVKNCDIELVKYFIKKGADPNFKDSSGETIYSSVNNLKKADPVYVALLMKAGFKADNKNKKGDTALDTARKRCRRQLVQPYDSKKLENCVETLAILSGQSVEKFIPVKCRGKLRLSRLQGYKYIKKKDGYYKWQRGVLVKVKLPDPCGKYRRDGSSGEIKEASDKPGVFGKWKFLGRSASSGVANRYKIGFGRPVEFYHDRYAGKNWELKLETSGVFKQLMILGGSSRKTKPEDMKMIYRGRAKTLSSKVLMKRGSKYPYWQIKMNGARRGFVPVKGAGKVYIRTD